MYFVSDSALTGSERNAQGEEARAGQPNMYVLHEGATKLVSVLSSADSPDWGHNGYLKAGGNVVDPGTAVLGLTARVSPDGEWLAFVSRRQLTGYDNLDVGSGRPDAEVYVYHASAGTLVCASCDPTGARPRGAARVPGWTMPLYQSRYLSDGGRLFFDSPDALVAQDTNDAEDVYELSLIHI